MESFLVQLAECKFAKVNGRPYVAKFLKMLCLASRLKGAERSVAFAAFEKTYVKVFSNPNINIDNRSYYWRLYKKVGERIIGKEHYVVSEDEQNVLVLSDDVMQIKECGGALHQLNHIEVSSSLEVINAYLEKEDAEFKDDITRIKQELEKELAA